MHYVARLQEAI